MEELNIKIEDCLTQDVVDVIADLMNPKSITIQDCIDIFNKGNQIFFDIYDSNLYDALLLAQIANGYIISKTIFYPGHLIESVKESYKYFPEYEKMCLGSYKRLIKSISKLSESDAQTLEITLRMMWNAELWKVYFRNSIIKKATLEIGDAVALNF